MKKLSILLLLTIFMLLGGQIKAQCDYPNDLNSTTGAAMTQKGATAVITENGWTWSACKKFIGGEYIEINGASTSSYIGYVASPLFSNGCNAISFSHKNFIGKKLKIEIKQDGVVVWDSVINVATAGDPNWYVFEKENLNITGNFQFVLTNTSATGAGANQSVIYVKDICITALPARNCDHTDDLAALQDEELFIVYLPTPDGWSSNQEAYVVYGYEGIQLMSTPLDNLQKLISPVFNDGCNSIHLKYYNYIDDSKPQLKLEIKQNGGVVWAHTITHILYEWTDFSIDNLNIEGEYQLEITCMINPDDKWEQAMIFVKEICLTNNVVTPAHNYQFNVPKNATVYVGDKDQGVTVAGNYLTKHYVPFTKQDEVFILETDTSNIWYYDLPAPTNASGGFSYRISSDDGITHVGLFKPKAGTAVEKDTLLAFTSEQLLAYSPKEIDHDEAHLDGRNVADVFININAQGYLTLPLQADTTFQLIHTRNWQAIDTDVNNYFIEPDFHYTVVDENGQPSNSVVTISETGLITPVGAGTAIVLIDYDAMVTHHTTNLGLSADSLATYGALFSKLWSENTGVFVVSVDQPEANIITNMNLNAFWAQDGTDKTDGVAIDAEHDVMYFEASQGSFPYTFTPEGVAQVLVATPTVGEFMTSYSGFTADSVVVNDDGSYTVKLGFGRNIVKLIAADDAATYQIITAKPVTYTVNNLTHPGEEFVPGDEVLVIFNRLYHPANKMSGIYNMSAGIQYSNDDINFPLILGPGQYTFASRAQEFKAIIPEDYLGEEFVLEKGVIKTKGFGSSYGAHRQITIQNGVNPNLNASVREAYFGAIPDIRIAIPSNIDEIAPSAPIDLTGVPFETYITLSWTASTDNFGVVGYNVYVDDNWEGATPDIVYTITDLTAATTYTLSVEAFDAAGNKSEKASITLTTTTPSEVPDEIAPTAPIDLTGVPFETTIALSWTASTDNVGVTGYNVYVDDNWVGATSKTTFTATGLTAATTYILSVEALDAAGNKSEKASITLTTTTTGIPLVQDNNMTLYPNPFDSYIILETTADDYAVIYNLSGKAMLSANIKNGSNYIETSALPQGVYVLKVGGNTVKIVK